MFRRLSVTGFDQALSSLTNFLPSVLAARLFGPEGLGVVALCMAVGFGGLGLTRAISGEPLLIFRAERSITRALSASLCLGLVLAVGVIAFALVIGGDLRGPFVALAVGLPIVVMQDTSRYAFFAEQRPTDALLTDVAWALSQGGALVVLALSDALSTTSFVAAWGLGGLAGFTYARSRLRPRVMSIGFISQARRWVRDTSGLSGWLFGQVVVSQALGQVTLMMIGAVAGLAALGGLRATLTLLAPLAILLAAISQFVLPQVETSSDSASRPLSVAEAVRRASLISSVLGAAYLVILLVGGPFLLLRLFGSEFERFTPLLWAIAITGAAQAAAVPPGIGNRALAAGRAVFLTQASASVIGIPLTILGAVTAGARGAAWGIAAQAVALCVVSWTTYLRAGVNTLSARLRAA